jgi:D-alanyl-D-alanine carboxypeptidase/D-alanyl-D-alanine-endopeptidase (penicillin-binding protein 4)
VAGVVQSPSGRRWVLVAMVNHPRAAEARPVLEALTQWVFNDAGSPETAGQDSAQP